MNNKIFVILLISLTHIDLGICATYDLSTNELKVNAVKDGEETYTNAKFILNANGTYVFLGGDLSNQPFDCTRFTDKTLDLFNNSSLKSQEINNLLGCRWSKRSLTQEVTIQGTSSETYVWIDDNCSSLTVTYRKDSVTGELKIKNVNNVINQLNSNLCIIDHDIPTSEKIFNLANNNKLYISFTTAEDNILASDALLEITNDQRYRLLHLQVSENNSPHKLCKPITENSYNSITFLMETQDIENILSCRWSRKIGSNQLIWLDTFCNGVSVITDSSGSIVSKSLYITPIGCATEM